MTTLHLFLDSLWKLYQPVQPIITKSDTGSEAGVSTDPVKFHKQVVEFVIKVDLQGWPRECKAKTRCFWDIPEQQPQVRVIKNSKCYKAISNEKFKNDQPTQEIAGYSGVVAANCRTFWWPDWQSGANKVIARTTVRGMGAADPVHQVHEDSICGYPGQGLATVPGAPGRA